MSSLPKNVKTPHFAAQRANNKKRLLIPDKDGTLRVKEPDPDIYHLKEAKKGEGQSTRRKEKSKLVKRAGSRLGAGSLKFTDIVAFNTKAESFFVVWLGEKVRGAGAAGVAVGWVYPNAAYELDVSIETAKRYLSKHTADMAEFEIRGGQVFYRD